MITAGTINYGFSTGLGFNDMVYIFRTQSDGKILVGGNFTSYNNINTYYITRLEQDGSLDTTFANGSFLSDYVKAIDVLSDGKIIVGGHFTNYNGSSTDYLVKLNTDGTLSQQFPNGFNDIVRVVKVQSDDKILVGGAFTTFNGNTYNYFLRLNSNGTVDSTFNIGGGFNGDVYSIQIESDGNILVGGNFTTYDGVTSNRIIRLDPNGTILNTFGAGADSRVQRVVLQPDGKILVGGQFTNFNNISSNYMVRLKTDGSVDTTFDFNDWVNDMYCQSDGKIVVVGRLSLYSGVSTNYIIRINPSGTVDNSFYIGGGFGNYPNRVIELADGNLLIGGWFNDYDGIDSYSIISLNNDVNTYKFPFVYTATGCSTVSGFEFPYPESYMVGSNVELTSGQTISATDILSPTQVQCMVITSETTVIGDPTYEYQNSYTDCVECLTNNSIAALIQSCVDGFTFPLIVNTNYKIGDIFTVEKPFYADFGPGIEGIFLNDAWKILDVAPYSDMLQALPFIVDYKPQLNCQDAQSCLGLFYEYQDCSNPDETGFIRSNQVLNEGDVIFLNSGETNCKTIISFSSVLENDELNFNDIFTGASIVTSTEVFQNCESCLSSLLNPYWETQTNGDGTINFVNSYEVDILGPNDEDNDGWSYIKFQAATSGSLSFNYVYTTEDGCEPTPTYDWGFYWVGNYEPSGDNIDFNSDIFAWCDGSPSGRQTINFNAGDWVAIGVYSDDSCCGPGLLNLLFDPFDLYRIFNFTSCTGDGGTIFIPTTSTPKLQEITKLYYTAITNNNLQLMDGSDEDDTYIEIPLPEGFNVNFLCQNYSTVYLSSNGYLTFSGGTSSCCFAIPFEIPDSVGYPGVYLSTSYGPSDFLDGMDDYLFNWYSGLTDNGNKFIVRFEGTYLQYDTSDNPPPLIFSFVFYLNEPDYFDLVIQNNTVYYNNNFTGGLSDGVHTNWVNTFDSRSQGYFRIKNNCSFKANFGTEPSICGSISQPENNNLGTLYSDIVETYDSCNTLDTQSFDFTGDIQTFTAPVTGTYTLELWGAQGGDDGNVGGNGGYSKGTVSLNAGDTLNIYVGGQGGDSASGTGGGYNGGGNAGPSGSSGGGGGATDIRLNGTTLTDRIIVAGGGGGAGNTGAPAGAGGGLNGVNGGGAAGGTQTSGGSGADSGSLGQGGNAQGDGGGGGGGYYGGGAGGNVDNGGGGGSSYLGGVQNGLTISGNLSMPSPDGGTINGKTNDGYVTISWKKTGTLCVELYNCIIKNCKTSEISYRTMTLDDIQNIQNLGPIFADGGVECYELLDYCSLSTYTQYSPTMIYKSCQECYLPLTSNTSQVMCFTCLSDVNSGVSKWYYTSVPRPTWTNSRGKAVIQNDAILLGGNGLNS